MPPLDPIATLFILLVGVLLPLVCFRSHRALVRGMALPPRGRTHRSTLISLGVLTALALWVAWRVGMTLFPVPRLDLGLAGVAAAGVAGLVVAGVVRWKMRSAQARAWLVAILPRTPRDFLMWLALCVAAGVGEEIVYRGVLFGTLEYWTGSWGVAAVLAAAAFGLAHLVQGWAAAGVTFAMALLAQWLVLRAGDLYLAMAAHFTYDVAVGFLYARMARQDGLFAEEEAGGGVGAAGESSAPRAEPPAL